MEIIWNQIFYIKYEQIQKQILWSKMPNLMELDSSNEVKSMMSDPGAVSLTVTNVRASQTWRIIRPSPTKIKNGCLSIANVLQQRTENPLAPFKGPRPCVPPKNVKNSDVFHCKPSAQKAWHQRERKKGVQRGRKEFFKYEEILLLPSSSFCPSSFLLFSSSVHLPPPAGQSGTETSRLTSGSAAGGTFHPIALQVRCVSTQFHQN